MRKRTSQNPYSMHTFRFIEHLSIADAEAINDRPYEFCRHTVRKSEFAYKKALSFAQCKRQRLFYCLNLMRGAFSLPER